jgi:hypothetical protein
MSKFYTWQLEVLVKPHDVIVLFLRDLSGGDSIELQAQRCKS